MSIWRQPRRREEHKKLSAELEAKIAPLQKQIAAIDAPYRKRIARDKRERLEPKYREALETPAEKRTREQKKLAADAGPLLKVTWDEIVAALSPADRDRRAALREQLHALEARMPPPPAAAWAIKNDQPAETFVLKRGDPKRKATSVRPAFPRVLTTDPGTPRSRLELAKWIASKENPLTARVIVNRLWQHHFGKGIVATPNDFGMRGERPTHPELLDWLASELVSPSPPTAVGACAGTLEPQAHPPPHRHQRHLQAVGHDFARGEGRPGQQTALAAEPAAARSGGDPGFHSGHRRHTQPASGWCLSAGAAGARGI